MNGILFVSSSNPFLFFIFIIVDYTFGMIIFHKTILGFLFVTDEFDVIERNTRIGFHPILGK